MRCHQLVNAVAYTAKQEPGRDMLVRNLLDEIRKEDLLGLSLNLVEFVHHDYWFSGVKSQMNFIAELLTLTNAGSAVRPKLRIRARWP